MGRKKNLDKKRLANLPHRPAKSLPRLQPTLTKDSESDSSDNDFGPLDSGVPTVDSDDEQDFDLEDLEEEALKEIQSDSDLLAFAAKLQIAHDNMVKQE
jgi:hypothetical protein